jgi:hypothetical protein
LCRQAVVVSMVRGLPIHSRESWFESASGSHFSLLEPQSICICSFCRHECSRRTRAGLRAPIEMLIVWTPTHIVTAIPKSNKNFSIISSSDRLLPLELGMAVNQGRARPRHHRQSPSSLLMEPQSASRSRCDASAARLDLRNLSFRSHARAPAHLARLVLNS